MNTCIKTIFCKFLDGDTQWSDMSSNITACATFGA